MHCVVAWMLFSTMIGVNQVLGYTNSHQSMSQLASKLANCGVEYDGVVRMGDKNSGCDEIEQLCDDIISAVMDEIERDLPGMKEMSFVAVLGKLIQRHCRQQAEHVTGLLDRIEQARRDIEHEKERSTESVFLEFSSGSGDGSGEDEYSLDGHPVSMQGSDVAMRELQSLLLRPLHRQQ